MVFSSAKIFSILVFSLFVPKWGNCTDLSLYFLCSIRIVYRKCLGNHLWPHRWFCLLRSQLRTGTVSRLFWITPTRCTSSLNQVCIQCSCQKHQWVRISLFSSSLHRTGWNGKHKLLIDCFVLIFFVDSGTQERNGKNSQSWCLSITTFLPSSFANPLCCLRILHCFVSTQEMWISLL